MKRRILKRGFELLRTRPTTEQINLLPLEEQYGLRLPPKYRKFVQLIDLSQGNYRNNYINALYPDGHLRMIASVVYFHKGYDPDTNDIMFAGFYTEEASISGYQDTYEDWDEEGYLQIAHCGHAGGVLLGTRGETTDKILIDDHVDDTKVIADNIFEFVRDLVLVLVPEEELPMGISYNQLYKNLGEDFWRVREGNIKDT